MSKAVTDRNLLFGILALQMDFISRDAPAAGNRGEAQEHYKKCLTARKKVG
jgi:hypothetical protein